ncbi:amidohydrolase family protein, partial [Candidatus Bipolaricaulota bacterium]|nr:amidohydrolase family protein [Candidatus Bipolaricaulota bacterium]
MPDRCPTRRPGGAPDEGAQARRIRISHARLVDASGARGGLYELHVAGGTIREIIPQSEAGSLSPGRERNASAGGSQTVEIDAGGRTLLPAFIDLHAHFRDPGFPEKETIESGSRAAAAGGYATVSVMANTRPVCDRVEVAQDIVARARRVGLIDVIPVGAITRRLEGRRLADLEQLSAVVWAFSDDGRGVQSADVAERAFAVAARLRRPIIEHCETDGVEDPDLSEERMAERDIRLAGRFGTQLHIAHVRSPRTQAAVARAREQSVA